MIVACVEGEAGVCTVGARKLYYICRAVPEAMVLGDPNDYIDAIVCGTMTVTTTIFLSYRSEFTLTINA